MEALRRRHRHVLTLVMLAALSMVLVLFAYLTHPGDFWDNLSLSLGTNLLIVIATYIIFNPLIEQVRTATTTEHPRLDHDAFIEHVANSRRVLCILTTWTNLLEDPFQRRFLSALRLALGRNVLVQILLLDPASKAADLRGEELYGRENVSRSIMENLRCLEQFRRDELSERMRLQLHIRVYTASPSVLFYRWDDRAFLSFFPLGMLTDHTPKLETFVSTPWADFVRRHFEELWNDTTTTSLDRYFRLPLVVAAHDGASTEFEVDYVILDGAYYVASPALIQFIAKHGIGNSAIRTRLADGSRTSSSPRPRSYAAAMLDELPYLHQPVLELFETKYGYGPAFTLRLSEAPSDDD